MQNFFINLKNNKIFEFTVVFVIIISALEVGVKTYDLSGWGLTITSYLDRLITIFFVCELTIRYVAEEDKKSFFKKGWNIFDIVVVLISIIPIQDSETALLARLIRIFRVLRMVSIVPELRVLINSLLKALPQLGYVVLLLFIIFYIYAAIGSYLFEKINPFLWGNISISMLTLFRVMTFEDWTDIQYETMEYYPYSWIFYVSFIFFTTFAFLNMVIGIILNVMEEEQSKLKNIEKNSNKDTKTDISLHEVMQELKDIKDKIDLKNK